MVRVMLGVVLLTAAALKGHQLATEPVAEMGLLTSRWFLVIVVEFELLFGLSLLAGVYTKCIWQVAVLCFNGFACMSIYKGISGGASCGCFGSVQVNPWYTFCLDTVAVAALLWWRPKCVVSAKLPKDQPGAPECLRGVVGTAHRVTWVAAIFLGVGIPAAIGMGSYRVPVMTETGDILGHGEIVVLEPEAWIGKRFPLLEWIDIGDQLAEGEWIVVLYHHDCPDCQQAIVRFEQLARDTADRTDTPQIALIEIPPYSESETMANSRCQHGRLCDKIRWFATTPIDLVIKGATVRRLRQEKGNRIPIYKPGTRARESVASRGRAPRRVWAAGRLFPVICLNDPFPNNGTSGRMLMSSGP